MAIAAVLRGAVLLLFHSLSFDFNANVTYAMSNIKFRYQTYIALQ
jgi:hypothetical protein